MTEAHFHDTHPALVQRLRRAEGHLRNVIEMIENRRDCLDLAQQLHAVERAISAAKKTLIHDHIDNCLEHAAGATPSASRVAMKEFREIAKYL